MVERFVVVGAGTMGTGIAYVAAAAGYAVELVEVDPARGAAAVDTLAAQLDKAVAKGRMDAVDAAAARARVQVIGALDQVQPEPDVVVEAVPERADLKHQVLRAEMRMLPPGSRWIELRWK